LLDRYSIVLVRSHIRRCPLTNCYEENHWRPWIENDWQREIKQQRTNIVEQAHIHQSHVKGFRAPHLQIDQNRHFEHLRRFHFHYDSSMLVKASNLLWPYTMNYPWDQLDCVNCDETIATMPSLWQFPLHEWIYPNGRLSSCSLTNERHE
jgi:hypothetical protein